MGKRTWLENDLRDRWLPLLAKLNDNASGHRQAENLCKSMRSSWSEKSLKTLKQQQSLMDTTRRAIKDRLGDDHFCLNYVMFSREESFELNNLKQGNARERQLHQQYLTDPDTIANLAVRLLDSPEWAEVAAGLAVVTGRRLNEVLRTAEFEIKSQWVVRFRGALKRRGEEVPLVFDIPTLTTAKRVVEGLQKLRKITPADANEDRVGVVSDRLFADLVPLPQGKTNLYAHLWRSVFCCIATFWYCPKHVDDLLFKAHVMGHFETLTREEQGDERKLRQRLETFSSERHYRLYEIDDSVIEYHKGKRKGIKLGHGGVEPLEVFVMGMPEHQPTPQERLTRDSIRIWKEDRALLDEIFDLLGLDHEGTQQNRMRSLLRWTHQQLTSQPKSVEVEPIHPVEVDVEPAQAQNEPEAIQFDALIQSEPELAQSTTGKVESPLETKIDTLVSAIAQLVQLQAQVLTNPTPSPAVTPASVPKTRQKATAPAPTEAEGQSERKYRPRGQNEELVNRAINAMMRHNDQAEQHDEKWAVTINALKAWVGSQHAITKGLEERRQEIENHHQKHQIDPTKHNLKHRGKRKIEEVIGIG